MSQNFTNFVSRTGIRMHTNTGATTFTTLTASAFADGGSSLGQEIDGTLMRNGLGFRIDPSTGHLMVDHNSGGTIKTWDLGVGV